MTGIYTNAMGMIHTIQKLGSHANNIANIQTNGYKAEQPTFKVFEEAQKVANYDVDKVSIGDWQDEVYVDHVNVNFKPGQYVATHEGTDFSLFDKQGEGASFFIVSKNGQEYLTRNGKFGLDGDRRLVTLTGGLIRGEDGNPITVPKGAVMETQKDGTIINSKTGDRIGKLGLVTVDSDHLQLMERKEYGLYQPMSKEFVEKTMGPISELLAEYDTNPTVRSRFPNKNILEQLQNQNELPVVSPFRGEVMTGVLEKSNVDMSEELVNVMKTQRHFQANQKAFTVNDQLLQKDANELGR